MESVPLRKMTIDEYLLRNNATNSSKVSYRKALQGCERALGKPLYEATEEDLLYLKEDYLRPMKGSAGSSYAQTLRSYLHAVGWSREALLDVLAVKNKQHRISPNAILSLDEVNAILEKASSMRDRALFAAMWATGQRVTAICSLTIGDLREVSSTNGGAGLSVFFRDVKIAGEEHTAFILNKEGADYIREWLKVYPEELRGNTDQQTVLFPTYWPGGVGGKPMSESGVLKILKMTAVRAGIMKRIYPHLFRHSRTTYLLRLGVPQLQVQKLLGWKNADMLQKYAHLVTQDAYNALATALGEEPDEKVDLGKLLPASGLKPVKVMNPPPVRLREVVVGAQEAEDITMTDDFQERVSKLVRQMAVERRKAGLSIPPVKDEAVHEGDDVTVTVLGKNARETAAAIRAAHTKGKPKA